MIDWLFRNRKTGRLTVAQVPNIPLILFLATLFLRWILDPSGPLDTRLQVLATGSLIWWAGDELFRGVNPWRRFIGAGTLAGQVVVAERIVSRGAGAALIRAPIDSRAMTNTLLCQRVLRARRATLSR